MVMFEETSEYHQSYKNSSSGCYKSVKRKLVLVVTVTVFFMFIGISTRKHDWWDIFSEALVSDLQINQRNVTCLYSAIFDWLRMTYDVIFIIISRQMPFGWVHSIYLTPITAFIVFFLCNSVKLKRSDGWRQKTSDWLSVTSAEDWNGQLADVFYHEIRQTWDGFTQHRYPAGVTYSFICHGWL